MSIKCFLLDAVVHKRRVKFGGNKKTKFTEGWVEFLSKRVAKRVARGLNNTPVGRKKRSYYHDDLWNLKYLPKFRWTHLAEKIGMLVSITNELCYFILWNHISCFCMNNFSKGAL